MASKFTITAELSLQTKNLNQVVSNLRQQFQNANLNIKIKDLANAQAQVNKLSSSAKDATKNVGLLGSGINQAFKRFTVITAVTGTIVGFTRALKNAVGDAIEFEREVVKIAQATGQTVGQLKGLVSEINSVSTSFGVSSKELILAARSLTQAGFAADKVSGALKILAQTELAATFDSIQDTTEGAIALLNQFGREAQKTGSEVKFLEQSFSAINQVSKEFAVESSDLVTAIRTTGSAFETAGGSLNELIALFTSVRSTTRESAESIATGFRTIFTRVQRVDTINNLRALGIELQDAEGKFIGPMEAAKKLSIALNSIDPRDFRFNLVVEELGGFRQVSKVIPLIQQFAVAQRALNVAQNSSGSLAKDAQTAQQALAVQIQKTREEFSKFIRELVGSETFQDTARFLLDIASAFIKVADSIKPLIPLIAGFGALKLGNALLPALASFSGPRRRSLGGPIGFAGGGFVPGVGNGDTIPAMLTPGEFVIRKSSVKKLGADNLARMNKYASGGPIKDLKSNIKLGSVYDLKTEYDKYENAKVIRKDLPKSYSEIRKLAIDTTQQISNEKFNFPETITKENGQQVDDTIAKIASMIKKQIGSKTDIVLNKSLFYNKDGKLIKDQKNKLKAFSLTKNAKGELSQSGGIVNFIQGRIGENLHESGHDKTKGELTKLKDKLAMDYKITNKNGQKVDLEEVKVLSKDISDDIIIGKALKYYAEERKKNLGSSYKNNSRDIIDIGNISFISAIKKKNLGGMIQKFALGGPAGKSPAARAITIPRSADYTFDKPAGVDLEAKNSKGQMYKLNAEDRLDYTREDVNVDVDTLKNVSKGLLKQYREEKRPDYRGYRFEDILMESGLAKLRSKLSNARLDGITPEGNPFEAKSTLQALNIADFEDKLYGAISDNISEPEQLLRGRFNKSSLTDGQDNINVGKVTVFQDVTGGLGSAVKAKARMDYEEEEAAKQAKEAAKQAKEAGEKSASLASDRLKDIVEKNFSSGYKISGFQYGPIGSKGLHRDVSTMLNQQLGGSYQDKIANMSDSEVVSTLKKFIVKKANGGAIERFASGGFASGTDTVPAMLTPGEYVINRKSAEKIGYSNLQRMNKVGKFANGGPVGMTNGGKFDPKQQRAARQKFVKTTLDPAIQNRTITHGQSNAIVGMIENAIKNGFDAEAVMKAISRQLNKATGQIKLDKGFQEKVQNAATRGGTLQPKEKEKKEEKEAAKFAGEKLLLLGSITTSVVSQLGLFNQKTADVVSSLTATFATIKGIGIELTGFGAQFKNKKGEQLIPEGALKGLNAGLTGFAAAQAVAAARITYLGQSAEDSGKKVDSFIDALSKGEGTSQGQITEALTKQFEAASEAQARGSGGAKAAGAIGALAAGGLAMSNPVTAPFAPIIASVAAPIIEEGLYQLGAFSDSTGKAKSQAEALSAAMFSATTSNRDFQKFFQSIDKQTAENVARQAQALAKAYGEQQAQIAKLGDLSDASETVKKRFELVSEAAKQTANNLQTIIGLQLENAVKRSSDLLNRGFVPDSDKLLKPVFDTIRSDIESRYKGRIDNAGGETTGEGKNLVAQRDAEIAKSQTELRKRFDEAAKQQLEMIAVLNIENNIRKDLIGSLQKQSAISASIERLSYELDLVSKSVSNVDAVFSGSLTGLKSSFDTGILKLKSPDQGKLNKALDPVRAIGPIGKDLADNLLNINEVMPTLEAKLIQFSTATDTAGGALFDVKKFVEDSFNIKADSIVGRTLVKIIEGTTTGTGGEKDVTAAKTSLRVEDVRKKIVESFQKFGEDFRTQTSGILENFERAEQEGRAIGEKINESRQKQLELQMQGIDTFSNYIDALARARGRDLSLVEKNTIRNMKQYALAGNMANNVGAISNELSSIYKDLQKGGQNPKDQANLSFTATKLKAALEDLANQSGKTSDILAEIEKQRAKRESARDFGKEFTFGSNEQRRSIANSIQGLQRVLTTGNINDVPEKLRSGVSSLLERFKDVPVFNGRTGRQVENKLIANQFRAMGGGAFADMIEADTSTPEQILIGELQRTFAVQIYAQQALSKIEQQKQELLQAALKEYTTDIGSYTAKLEALVQEFQKKAEEQSLAFKKSDISGPKSEIASPQVALARPSSDSSDILNNLVGKQVVKPTPIGAKSKIDLENIQQTNAAIENFEQAITTSDQKIYEFTARLENFVKVMEQNADTFKAEKEQREEKAREEKKKEQPMAGPGSRVGIGSDSTPNPLAEGAFRGGLIYRAGGGSIFQPKGTDTVPAMLTPGEYVIKKSSVDKIGKENLDAINNGYFAKGGPVGYYQFGGRSSFGSYGVIELEKRIKILEDKNKKLELENTTLKKFTERILLQMRVSQDQQQMMGAMTTQPVGMGFGMQMPMMRMGSRNRARERAKQRGVESIFEQEGFTKPKVQPIPIQTENLAMPSGEDAFQVNPSMPSGEDAFQVNPFVGPPTKQQAALASINNQKAIDAKRAALGKRLIEEAKAADKARNEERAKALNPVGPPVPRGMRPANSMYTAEQWAQMQEKAAKEKELSNLRVAELRKQIPSHIEKKYGERPSYQTEERWLQGIIKDRQSQESQFFADITKKGLKSKISDYGKVAASPYSIKTQKGLDDSKALNKQVDEMTERRFGKAVGTNYKSLEDVPVLSAAQVGRPVTLKDIKAMQEKAKAPAITGTNLTLAEQVANNVAANQPNQYESINPLSDFLNAQGQIFGNQAIANRVAESQSWQGIARAGSFNRESKAMIENAPKINTGLPDLNYLSSAPSDIGASSLDILKKKPLPGFAKGGSTDTVPAMLTPGEYVMNSKSVGKYGKAFMDHLNRGGEVPGFQKGGPVGYYQAGGEVGGMGSIAETFSGFISQFQEIAKMMTGMTMTHTVTVDGQLNIGGINAEGIANQIRDAIGNYVGEIVTRKFDEFKGRAG